MEKTDSLILSIAGRIIPLGHSTCLFFKLPPVILMRIIITQTYPKFNNSESSFWETML